MRLPFPTGLRYMAAGALAFSVMSLLVKMVGARIPTMEVVLARSVVLLVLARAALLRRGASPWGNNRRLLLLRGVLGFTALTCFYYAVIHLPLADATVIQYTNPVFTALLAAVVLSEALRAREVVLALASLGGVVLLARPAFLFGGGAEALDPLATGIALTGAVFSAAAYVTVRRLGKDEDAMVIVFWFALVSVIGALPATLPVAVLPTRREWLLLLAVGVTTHLGQVFLTWGLQRERAGRAMAVGYLQIVFAGIWGFLFFAEVPDRWGVAGALVIVGSTYLVARSRRGVRPAPDAAAD